MDADLDILLEAMKIGFRHFDASTQHKNSACLGTAIAESSLQRTDIFITCAITSQEPSSMEESEGVVQILTSLFQKHLLGLQTDFVDALVLHSTGISEDVTTSAWQFLELCHAKGKARALGLLSGSLGHFQAVWDKAVLRPRFQKMPWSLYFPGETMHGQDTVKSDGPPTLLSWSASHGMRTMALVGQNSSADGLWPFPMLNDPHVKSLARRHYCSPAQVVLKYLLELGFVVGVQSLERNPMGDYLLAVECGIPRWEFWPLTGLASLAHPRGADSASWALDATTDVFGLRAAAGTVREFRGRPLEARVGVHNDRAKSRSSVADWSIGAVQDRTACGSVCKEPVRGT